MSRGTQSDRTVAERTNLLHLELAIDEPNVVAYLSMFEDEATRRDKAIEALKVGVIAIRSASPTLDTTVVQEKFSDLEDKMKVFLSQFMEDVEGQLTGYFKDQDGVVPKSINVVFGEDGKLGRTFQHYFDPAQGRLGQLMQQQIGPASVFGRALDPKNKDGILTQIEGRVQQLVESKLNEVLGQFSLDNEMSAMCRLHKMLADSFAEIHQSLGIKAATAVEAERGHVKGIEFEADLYEVFADLGRRLGDETESVRGTPGALRKKTGDFHAALGESTGAPGTRIVVEVKNQRMRFKDAVDELQEAKANREAAAGIFVFAKGSEPAEMGDFRRVGQDFYCTVDKEQLEAGVSLTFFEAAYEIARAMVVATVRAHESDGLDLKALCDHVDGLVAFSEKLSDICTKARTVRNSGEAIEKVADGIKKDLEARIAAMKEIFQSGATE